MGAEVLLILLILWAIVTLVGHGTWALLSRIFGGGASPTKLNGRAAPRGECPRCSSELEPLRHECRACGWPREPGRKTDALAALASLRRQLARLHELEAVDVESVSAILAVIVAQQERLKGLADAEVVLTPVEESPPATAPAQSAAPPVQSSTPVRKHTAPSAAERVREYAERRVAAMEAAAAEPAAAPSPKRREALSRVFAAFMEEKNIRWGELVGGLLIVGCSVALVISFWAEIAANAMLKFGLLGGVTAALFGVGLYTDRKWKIPTTSHGILVIASLLVPLHFLAIAAFTQGAAANDALTLAGEAVSTLVFGALLYLAGKVIAPGAARIYTAGVLIPSLAQLVVRRFADPSTTLLTLYALAAVPVVSYLATTSIVTRQRLKVSTFDEPTAFRLLTFLGVVSAATFFPLALLAWHVPTVEETLHRLSPLVVWCGVPALVCGLVFWRRMNRADLTAVQTAGLAVGVLGAAIMAGAAVAAWPDPATLLPVAAMNFVALTLVAFWFGIAAAHVPAGLALVGIWLVGIHLWRGNVGWTLDSYQPLAAALVSAASGRLLVPLVAAFGIVAGLLRHRGRRDDALMYGLVAAATATASLVLVAWFGFGRAGDSQNIVWTLGVYAVAALIVNWYVDRPATSWIGPALALATLWQAIVCRWPATLGFQLPSVTALLAYASIMILSSSLVWFRRGHIHLCAALQWAAAITSVAAAGLLATAVWSATTLALATYLAWIAAVWLGLALLTGWAWVFACSQIATVLAVIVGVTAGVETRDWYQATRNPWLDPWFISALGTALAAFALVMGGVRWFFRSIAERHNEAVIEHPVPAWHAVGSSLLDAPSSVVDRWVRVAVVAAFVAVAIYAAVPGVAQELAPLEAARGTGPAVRVAPPIEAYRIAEIDQSHAASSGVWWFGAAVVAAIGVGLGERRHAASWALALVVVLAMVCPLLAARWEAEVAVASALRWISAVFFLVGSAVLWYFRRGKDESPFRIEGLRWLDVRNLLIALTVFVYLAMGCYVAWSALDVAGAPGAVDDLWPWVCGWTLVAGTVGLVFPLVMKRQSLEAPNIAATEIEHRFIGLRNAILMVAVAPFAVLGAFAVAAALDQHPIAGPDPASWFRRIGWDVTYGVPLAIIALGLVGHAIRDRSSGLAFSAGLLTNVVATIVVLMRVARGGGGLDAVAWVTVAQINAIVAGIVALAWLGAVRWSRSRVPLLLVTQVSLAAALCGMFLLPAGVRLVDMPAAGDAWVRHAGEVLGWVALALSVVAAGSLHWLEARRGPLEAFEQIDVYHDRRTTVWRRANEPAIAYFLLLIVTIAALVGLRWDVGDWLAYHVLLVGLVAAAWVLPLGATTANRWSGGPVEGVLSSRWGSLSARFLGAVAIVVALRALDGDPQRPWWTIGAIATISLRNVWITWRERGWISMWIAAALANLAVSVWWVLVGMRLTGAGGYGQVLELVWINSIVAAGMAVVSGVIEAVWVRRQADLAPMRGVGYHRFAAWAVTLVVAATAAAGLIGDLLDETSEAYPPLGWLAWWTTVAAVVACWWDPRSRARVACLYCVGLVAVALFLDGLNLRPPLFQWAVTLALAAYSLATSLLWNRRREIGTSLSKLDVPRADAVDSGYHWLVTANGICGLVVVGLVAWIESTMPEFRHRMIAAYAVGAEAIALALLARGVVRSPLQYASLVFGVLFAIAFGWAWLPPEMPAPWLHRVVVSIVAIAAVMVIYGLGFAKLLKRENEWTRAAERLVPSLAVIAAALLAGVLAIEVRAFAVGQAAPIAWPALVAVAVALVGLAVAAMIAALVPGRDPLGLSERGRTAYVYATEILLGLTFVHIRVTLPELFTGWFAQFWPMIVMVIAFVGVGLGEFFQRRRTAVLSEPLTTTGALLPLLPALGFWIHSSEVHYSLLLLTVGVLYAAVSALRKSFWFAVLAALAANGSLWYLLYSRGGLAITEHPQLWLIPPALCVLAAGFLNRERLTAEQSAALRYGSAIVIYASSTADIFINGVANAPWLPAVLAGLSILGVLAGIMFRVRAFLYLGVTFLTVAIATVIWYAAIEQERTWILWVAGIITGVAIIALFGVFEKRREDVLRVVERLKQWEA